VKVCVGHDVVEIYPGQQIVLSRQHDKNFSDINPGAAIACRDVRERTLDGNIRAFVCRFSIPSAFLTVIPLHNLLMSKVPAERRLADEILKASVILDSPEHAHAQYQKSGKGSVIPEQRPLEQNPAER
jgi:hypothetical protein